MRHYGNPLRRLVMLLAGSMLLAACAAPIADSDSPFYVLPAGTRFVIERPVTVPPNTAHVTFQYGRPVVEGNLQGADAYYPHCRLEIADLAPTPRIIAPDTYRLRREQVFNEMLSAPDTVNFRIYYYLENDKGETLTLVCAQRNDAWEFDYVSLPQMREALGEYVSIELPDNRR